MTRRHEALVPLTHDHHHTLAQARRLKGVPSHDVKSARSAADDFVNFYLGRVRHHFREEEELFFAPMVDDDTVGPLVARAVADHLRLHALVRTLRRQQTSGEVSTELLTDVAELLESHVRLEEQQLFPLIEQNVAEEVLLDLAVSGRRDV